jgi:hypothetical protein
MTFWTSSELYKDIRKQFTPLSIWIEKELTARVQPLTLKTRAIQWALIYMISPEPYRSVFPEVVRWSSRRTVLEFRLLVDYDAFKRADEIGRFCLLLDCVRRSVELMTKLKVEESDRTSLLEAVDAVEQLFRAERHGPR